MTAALEVRGITKRFQQLVAVDQVSFEIQPGEIHGFIGPNGAGKTTTMRICATLEMPDEGDVLIEGVSVLDEPRFARARLGFMPDNYGAYPNTTLEEYLDFFSRAYGLKGVERRRTIADVIEFTGLGPLGGKLVTALSKGQKQRLCLAKTLLPDPKVLVLDEPAAGLDPRARVELRELVIALSQMGKALLISSHILPELAEMCQGVSVIEAGKLVATGAVSDIQRGVQAHCAIFLKTLEPREVAERALAEEPHVARVAPERDGLVFEFTGDEAARADLLTRLVQRGLRPVQFAPEEVDLEDLFMRLTQGKMQ